MPNRPPVRAAAIVLLLPLLLAPPAQADPVRLVASDDRGVTLELALAGWELGRAGPDGRSLLTASGLAATALPGLPILPSATTLIALPPGARAVLGTIGGDPQETREGVRVTLGSRRGFIDDPQGLGYVPFAEAAEPVQEGPWPAAPVELGVPFTLRGQRMVAVTLRPFRYDEATARLSAQRRLRVRIEFAGAAATGEARAPVRDDPHWDPVLKGALLNYAQGRAWRTRPPAATRRAGVASPLDRVPGREAGPAGAAGAAQFDESEPEVRIPIDSTGVYALTYAALASRGFPAGVPIGEVSVHRHEYVEDAKPAYVTIELPIEIEEAAPANGTFDGGDRIIVFVQSWAERSGATRPQRAWGDGEVIYATRVARPGRRIAPRVGWLDLAGPTPLASYPWTQRWEKNLSYMSFPGVAPAESLFDNFHWTTLTPYFDRPETVLFEANDIDASRDIGFTIAWQGRRNGVPYYIWGQVRNGDFTYSPIADSAGFSGKANFQASATLPGTAITEGLTNSLVQWARVASSPAHPSTNAFATVSLNWFEATYWRSFRPLRDYLSCNSAEAAGPFEVLATGFSDSTTLRAWDVTDPGEPRRLTGVRREGAPGAFALRFQDDATAGRRRYIVFSQARAVPASRMTAVTRGPLLTDRQGDYLLIVPEAWRAAAQPLAALRAAQGHAVLVCPTEAIYDEFGGGRRSAHAVKRFLRYALNNWDARFVILGGDASEDPQRFTRDPGPDIVPVHLIPGPVGVPPDGRETVPSDGWYAWCLNGCPPDPVSGLSPPIVPELFVGRLPATSAQALSDVVAKLVAYEDLSGDQSWRNRHVLTSDDEYSGVTTFGGGGGNSAYCLRFYEDRFRLLNETIRAVIVDSAGLRRSEVEHMDLGFWLRNEPNDGGSPPCRPDANATQNRTRATFTPALFSRLNAGRMWWNYQGHANEFLLAHENFYRNIGGEDDKNFLVNDGRPFLFSAFSCHANAFARISEGRADIGPALGEEMMMMPLKGAIASWASVGYEIIPDNGTDHINVAWARAMFLDPPRDDVRGDGDRGARALLGETIALGLLRYIPTVRFDPTENGLALTYTLLGDPATRLSIGPPQALVTANGDTVQSGRPVALAPPSDTLHLEADLVSNVEIRQIVLIEGGSGGSRIIPDSSYTLSPEFPDTLGGGRRYHLSYVTPLRAGVVRYTLRTVDRHGMRNDFEVVFPFFTQLRVSDNPLAENDVVTPNADLSLRLALPTPINDPQAQLAIAVDSLPQPFTATATDTTRRAWILRWSHDPYPAGEHVVALTALDSLRSEHRFRVVDRLAGDDRMLRDVMAFPNPFDDQLGTAFSFYLLADGAADVMVRVFTVSGRLIHQRLERGLAPGYHQWPWNGQDDEGDRLANGVYLYKMVATTGARSDSFDGRLVKLRRPRRGDIATP